MSADGWFTVRIAAPRPLSDVLANFLLEQGSCGVLVDDAAEEARLEAALPPGGADTLGGWLASLSTIDPDARRVRVETIPVVPVDWPEVARRHHRPRAIGRRFVVAPPWDVPHAPDREVLVIEPGMAFGTGAHATTRACLEAIEAAVAERPVAAALDVGTGSGILAAGLVRLGVARVVAVDADPAVLGPARENLVRNGAERVVLVAGRPASVRGAYDLVVANLLADAITSEAGDLARRVAPRGRLVVSGLLADQVGGIRDAFPAWTIVATSAEAEWRTLALERTA